MIQGDPLALFLTPVQDWFRQALGEPTPAQRQGWPAIKAGRHTLILAPTGSGKTLAAFLSCLDDLWRQEPLPRGVRILYVSPLKALNNDIARNLRAPLAGVTLAAERNGRPLPAIDVAVRTGDTPAAERQRLVRRPPHVLITTPESLHLLLTSRARETLRSVTHCIVDEIHALCPNKRGVFLSLLLERLEELTPQPFIRIGLSATQRPLEEVARYLGGFQLTEDGRMSPRPVAIIDAGLRKDLDLQVISPAVSFGPLPEKSVWPSIYRLLGEEIRRHRSTIVFANNRRTVERITAHLNDAEREALSAEREKEGEPSALHTPRSTDLARAHHGSVALEVRHQTEQALKEGRLPAVVATASLELGIDMGAVDLVCQVESPGTVSRGLQRVGRAGHLVGKTSKGRLIGKMPSDLLEQAVLAREMAAGRVEEIRVPINCLDVLAQQVVALVAVEDWHVADLFRVVRRAYPYRDLSPQLFEAVLEMLTGRYRFEPPPEETPRLGDASVSEARLAGRGLSMGALQPRISWDRIHNRLHALPGSRQLALVSGGVIPDTGQYPVYLTNGVRLGELDEEFVYERRVGDTFLLGTNTWRLERIEMDRVVVSPAPGKPAMAPFWRGERGGRSLDLGRAMGQFLRELAGRLDAPDCQDWLAREYYLDTAAARQLLGYVRRQIHDTGLLPTDRTLLIEASRDPLGDWQVILLSPLGYKAHFALRLALEARLYQRLGYKPEFLHHDDGILIRLSDTDEPLLDLFEGLTADNVENLLLAQLARSALFALRFRQNAARALLLPRTSPGKRAPLWLQRLRGRDLLQVARRQPDFPIVAETFRECLHDHLDLPHVQELLADISAGRVEVITRRVNQPSPFAAGLLFAFTAAAMYQLDGAAVDPGRAPNLDPDLLGQLVASEQNGHLLDPRAIRQVEHRLRGFGHPPRSAAEMAEWLRRLGDLAAEELDAPMSTFLTDLEMQGRAKQIELPAAGASPESHKRWILAEEETLYRQAFGFEPAEAAAIQAAAETILFRFLETHALVGLSDVLQRYPFERSWAQRKLESWAQSGRLVTITPAVAGEAFRWSAPANLEQVQRGSLALLRSEVTSCPPVQFADFVLRWQGVHPESRRGSAEGLAEMLGRLQGIALPAELWEQTVLPGRILGYQPRWLDESIASGEWAWACRAEADGGPGLLAFWNRARLGDLPPPAVDGSVPLDPIADQVVEHLRGRGASFVADIAQACAISPSAVRAALWTLLRQGLVTNDHFDVIRKGEQAVPVESAASSRRPRVGRRVSYLPRRGVARRPEGRWSLLPWGRPDPEKHAVWLASVLLQRYGIVARELAQLDAGMLPWRILYEVFSRMELAGEVRRGYFVEGLSGAQFALPEAARRLGEMALPATSAAPVVLIHSQDPANLYGSGAPFDIPLLDGCSRPLARRAGNWLVLRAGRPVLIAEQQGKRLTTLPSARGEDVPLAVSCLPGILAADRGLAARRKLSVAEWNGQPVTATEGQELLAAAGFVRDYQEMALYGGWR
jgi:ATP-dependent Lhr-like helicase